MFKLKTNAQRPPADAAPAGEKKGAKKAHKSGVKRDPKSAARAGGKAVSKSTSKVAPRRSAQSADGKAHRSRGAATTQRLDTVLRKRNAGQRVDLGIGAVSIEPSAGAPRTLGLQAAEAVMEKKGTDVTVLDVREISGLCDEMVVATARSVTHLNALADGVEEAMRKLGERLIHADGRHSAEPDWILLDYGNMMVHLFRAEARENYRLDAYYAEARLLAKWKND